jgi:poly(hydroxyalkanoate) depolymerase family esterase
VFLYTIACAQTSLTKTTSFGSNPGKLNMYSYVPVGLSDTTSLVVALHGCTQSAATFAAQTGWNKLADKHKFLVLYPEQTSANNSAICFNWFDSLYQKKNQLEVLSIKQMVDYMKLNYVFDTTKIFITGLSAGACMTSVMMANYPTVFNKGAIMAGVPFKGSSDTATAFKVMSGAISKTPVEWGKLVQKSNPTFKGTYPHVAIFHGTADGVVNIKNATELIKQWTFVNHADTLTDYVDKAFQGDTLISKNVYNDSLNKPVVVYYKLKNMGHGISVDTGSCARQGGATSYYAIKTSLHSTYWAADFFGIIKQPYTITGTLQISENSKMVNYRVSGKNGSTYTWTVPDGAIIASGQGSNSINVNFGTKGGIISVQELTTANCVNDKAWLNVAILKYNLNVTQTKFIKCHGDVSAQLTANVNGGNGTYNFKWLPGGATTAVLSELKADTYSLTVMDSTFLIVSSIAYKITEPNPITTYQTHTLCDGKQLLVGSYIHTTSGTFVDTLKSYLGCDSLVTTHLTIFPENKISQDLIKCNGESIGVGNNIYDLSGIYVNVLTSSKGCDSTITTFLTIKNAIDVVVNIEAEKNGIKLIANQSNAKYQWINCNNNDTIISDALTQSYFSSVEGSFAVIVSENNCSDTSFCFSILSSAIKEKLALENMKIYPNPFNLYTTISFDKPQNNILIKMIDVMGIVIKMISFSGNQLQINRENLKSGIYFIQIIDGNKNVFNKKIVID